MDDVHPTHVLRPVGGFRRPGRRRLRSSGYGASSMGTSRITTATRHAPSSPERRSICCKSKSPRSWAKFRDTAAETFRVASPEGFRFMKRTIWCIEQPWSFRKDFRMSVRRK